MKNAMASDLQWYTLAANSFSVGNNFSEPQIWKIIFQSLAHHNNCTWPPILVDQKKEIYSWTESICTL